MSELLQKALAIKRRKPGRLGKELDPSAAIAWAKGEVSMTQLITALGISNRGVTIYTWMCSSFRLAVEQGLLVEKEKQ